MNSIGIALIKRRNITNTIVIIIVLIWSLISCQIYFAYGYHYWTIYSVSKLNISLYTTINKVY